MKDLEGAPEKPVKILKREQFLTLLKEDGVLLLSIEIPANSALGAVAFEVLKLCHERLTRELSGVRIARVDGLFPGAEAGVVYELPQGIDEELAYRTTRHCFYEAVLESTLSRPLEVFALRSSALSFNRRTFRTTVTASAQETSGALAEKKQDSSAEKC